jgi:uncharacterized membrane protein
MMGSTRATAVAVGGRGGGGIIRPVLWALAVVVVLVALTVLLGAIRDTVLLSSPEVQRAEAKARVAEADHRTAELQRETAHIQGERATEAAWQPLVTGVGQLTLVALPLLGVVALVAAGVGTGLLVRRHLSLPTRDGRVPLVGLDRELSAEALFRYQVLQGRGASFEALPVSGSRRGLEEVLEPEPAPSIEAREETGDESVQLTTRRRARWATY